MSSEVENHWVLYECVGDGWRLPVYVMDRGDERVQITRVDGFPYLKSQRAIIFSTLEQFGPMVTGCWFVKKSDLGKFAERSRFTDPEDVVVWRKPEAPIEADDFLAAYCKWDRAMISNPAAAAVIWDSFCRFMQHWLVNKQQSVNLGFAKLYALQARANWKQILLGRYNRKLHGFAENPKAERPPAERHDDIHKLLVSTEMTAYEAKQKIVRWTLEVVPDKGFVRTCQVLEESKKAVGDSDYFTKISEQLKRQIPNAYQIFRAHVLETRHPMLLLPQDWTYQRRRNYVGKEKGQLIKDAPNSSQTPAVFGRGLERGGIADVVSADSLVSEMCDLQSRCPNVRDAGGDVGEPTNDGEGAIGLLVSDATQGESEGQLLSVQQQRWDDGLDSRTELGPV